MESELSNKVLEILESGDSFAAIEYVSGLGDALQVAQSFSELIREFYRHKRIDEMVLIGRAGVHFCLQMSNLRPDTDPTDPTTLRKSAQKMSYNLSANVWPGWEEPGVTLSDAHVAFGLDMARLDLRLAQEMEYPPKKLSNAYWIIGAQELAMRRPQAALESFELAQQAAAASDDADQQQMTEGYIGIALSLLGNPEGAPRIAAAIENLEASPGEDGKFFAKQVQSVLEFFRKY